MDAPPAQIECLAQTIYGEARGESLRGKRAVAQVIINRVRSKRYPNTICGVVRQKHQFSGYSPRHKPPQSFYKIARTVLSYSKSINNYLFFNTKGPNRATKIGRHFFWN